MQYRVIFTIFTCDFLLSKIELVVNNVTIDTLYSVVNFIAPQFFYEDGIDYLLITCKYHITVFHKELHLQVIPDKKFI